MIRIFKYPLPFAGSTTITASVRHWLMVEFQQGGPFVWAEVDDSHTDTVLLQVLLTGDPVPERAQWIGSAQREGHGPTYVIHVYQVVP